MKVVVRLLRDHRYINPIVSRGWQCPGSVQAKARLPASPLGNTQQEMIGSSHILLDILRSLTGFKTCFEVFRDMVHPASSSNMLFSEKLEQRKMEEWDSVVSP